MASACPRSIPSTSGVSGRNQGSFTRIHLQSGSETTAIAAAAGIVVIHASPMAPTICQWTWRARRRPTPIPTTDEETTWVVLTGAPINEEATMTAAELPWLTRPSRGRSRTIRRPIVRTMDHPPMAVPSVSMTPHPSFTHTGAASVGMWWVATRRAATIPIAFWASLEP